MHYSEKFAIRWRISIWAGSRGAGCEGGRLAVIFREGQQSSPGERGRGSTLELRRRWKRELSRAPTSRI